jgi:N-acyl homoserine lactone hydrolase
MLTLLLACAVARVPHGTAAPETEAASLEDLLTPGPIHHEVHVSARTEGDLSGLLDLSHPAAPPLKKAKVPIVLPVHVLDHPDFGTWVVDTGVTRGFVEGTKEPAKGLLRLAAGTIVGEAGLATVLDDRELAGVLITHAHLDHILGLPDVPAEVPVYLGPDELEEKLARNALTRRTSQGAFEGHDIRYWDFDQGQPLGPVDRALDVLGDGSIWALYSPGHTPGSTAFLVRTTEGPVLLTGDVCHTLWGWDNGVPPGGYSSDAKRGAMSFDVLRRLSSEHPQIRVYVGHEIDGEETGVDLILE